MNTRTIFLLINIVVSTIGLYASDAKFNNINAIHGINMRETASICSDDDGFIWVSSKTGILRLTDDDYRIYQLPYQTADVITVKLVYKKPVLLAYSNNGQVFRYNMISDRFDFLFDMREPLNSIHLFINNMLIEDPETFWIASSMGLYQYRTSELIHVRKDVTQIIWNDEQHLFLGNDWGIWYMDINTLNDRCIYENTSPQPFQIQKLFYDSLTKTLWIGTLSNGLFRFDFNANVFSAPHFDFFPKQPILAITANSDSTILIGIDGQGVWEIDKNNDRILNIYRENLDDPSSLRGDGVYDIFCDQNNRIWVSSHSGGVSYIDRALSPAIQITHQINNSNSLSNNQVNKIIEDSRGKIWFATNNGISCWDMKTDRWQTFFHNKQEQAKAFLSLCEDNEGRIWAGTYSSGIYLLDGITGKQLAHYSRKETGSMVDDFAFDIFKDSSGDLWIGGVRGEIIRYYTGEDKFRAYPSQPVQSFAELSHNKILIACTYGLVLLDVETSTSTNLLSGYLLRDLTVLNGNIWMGSSGNGLIYFNLEDQSTEIFTAESGLPSNYVNSIAYTDGFLWLGTENGLCRFDPANKTVETYVVSPLSDLSYNMKSHCQLTTGQLIWGTGNGAVLFDPANIRQLQPHGKIFYQNLLISGRSVRENLNLPLDSLQKITLKYNQNTLMLELIPINATANTRFSWKMEGLDKEWSQPSNLRMVSYTNMPSGNFLLKIKLFDSSLSYILNERDLWVQIIPPFWRTWWFILLVFVLLIGVLYFILRYYLIRLKQRHTEEKVRFFTHTAHDVRTSLTLIRAPIEELNKERHLTDNGHHYLHLAQEHVQRLSKVATQLLDFQKMDIGKEQISLGMTDIVKLIAHRKLMFESLAKSKNIELIFTSNQPAYMTAVDESMMEKVVDNLLSNAIKYSHPDSQIDIMLHCRKKEWEFEVKDYGIGISKKAQRKLFREFYRSENAINYKIIGSGIGLMLVKNYIVMHGGRIGYASQEGIGSTFRMIIPFKEVKDREVVVVQNEKPSLLSSVDLIQSSQNKLDTHKKDTHILIVEDNDDLRRFIQRSLSEEFKVTTAEDGSVAWEIICKEIPDLVISDVMMPNMDGFELCRLLKSSFETSHIPVILLTTLSDRTEQLHGLGLDADDYLTKPFDMGLLQQRIRSIIKNREILRSKTLKLLKTGNDDTVLVNKLNNDFVKKAVEVIRTHISNSDFNKDEFAFAMNVSSSLLYKKIKTFTDQSPVDFIRSIRLNHALELLQSRKYSITEVSELCGFSSIGYFGMVFKKHFGKQPSEYL